MKEKNYSRLKELKKQKDATDLWAKNQGDCELVDTSTNESSLDENNASVEARNDESIVTDENGKRSVDFNCSELTGRSARLRCAREEALCSAWIQENDESGDAWLSHANMPACPCSVNDVLDSEPKWEHTAYTGFLGTSAIGGLNISNYLVRKYHKGALGGCARSETVEVGNPHPSAQLCCYDEGDGNGGIGQLITSGTGAGTPDIDAADSGKLGAIFDGHVKADVDPWGYCGADIYNQIRKPNNANNCAANKRPR